MAIEVQNTLISSTGIDLFDFATPEETAEPLSKKESEETFPCQNNVQNILISSAKAALPIKEIDGPISSFPPLWKKQITNLVDNNRKNDENEKDDNNPDKENDFPNQIRNHNENEIEISSDKINTELYIKIQKKLIQYCNLKKNFILGLIKGYNTILTEHVQFKKILLHNQKFFEGLNEIEYSHVKKEFVSDFEMMNSFEDLITHGKIIISDFENVLTHIDTLRKNIV